MPDETLATQESAEAQTLSIKSWLKLALDWKDLATYFVVLVAMLYGLGWMIQYQAIIQLGVGPITVGREEALASGIGLMIYLAPIGFYWFMLIRVRRMKEASLGLKIGGTLLLAIFVLCACLSLWTMTPSIELSAPLLGTNYFNLFVILLVLVTPTALILDTWDLPVLNTAFMILSPFLIAGVYARFLLPELPEYVGGQGRKQIAISLKEPHITAIGTLIAMDGNAVVLKQARYLEADGKLSAPLTSLRLPMNRVVEIRPRVVGNSSSPVLKP